MDGKGKRRGWMGDECRNQMKVGEEEEVRGRLGEGQKIFDWKGN